MSAAATGPARDTYRVLVAAAPPAKRVPWRCSKREGECRLKEKSTGYAGLQPVPHRRCPDRPKRMPNRILWFHRIPPGETRLPGLKKALRKDRHIQDRVRAPSA